MSTCVPVHLLTSRKPGIALTASELQAAPRAHDLTRKESINEVKFNLFQNRCNLRLGLGDKDKAFEWLEKDFQDRNGKLAEIRWQIQFEPLRDDPRFKDLIKRIGLPQ